MMRKILKLLLGVGLFGTAAGASGEGSELRSFHCLHGCPVGASATNDVIVREIYTLSSNDLTKMADWVAYRIMPETIGPSEGRDWLADPWLGKSETLAPRDYQGASSALHIDRGHQVPLASFSGTPNAEDTNILSNITPQSSALNQGPWVRLEDAERELTKRQAGPVYVYTGPLFERLMRPLPGTASIHRVPSGYWKVIALPDGRYSGFIFDQGTSRRAQHCTFRAPLLEIELRARLDLFPDATTLPPGNLDVELGCTVPPPPRPAPSEIPSE